MKHTNNNNVNMNSDSNNLSPLNGRFFEIHLG